MSRPDDPSEELRKGHMVSLVAGGQETVWHSTAKPELALLGENEKGHDPHQQHREHRALRMPP